MSFSIPNLDDKNFEELFQEAINLIPRYSPAWTNYNLSDPGITLIDLMAWVTESQIYRLNLIPDATRLQMMELIGIEQVKEESIEDTISRAIIYMDECQRLVNETDYQDITKRYLDSRYPELGAKVITIVNRKLSQPISTEDKPGHVSVILLPKNIVADYSIDANKSANQNANQKADEQVIEGSTPNVIPTERLTKEVQTCLDGHRLLTQRLHVVAPLYRKVGVRIQIVIEAGGDWEGIHKEANRKIQAMIHPITGKDGKGWPIGRGIYRSELFDALGSISGVEYIQGVTFAEKSNYIAIEEFKFLQLELEIQRIF